MFNMSGMTEKEKADFNEADKKVHKVEDEWHYPIMTKHGWVTEDREKPGFVRSYLYKHPILGKEIRVTTGVNAEHWEGAGGHGYWADLEPHVKMLNEGATHEAICPRGYVLLRGSEKQCKDRALMGHSVGVITVRPIKVE